MRDVQDEHRFVVEMDDAIAELVYQIESNRLILVHTEVPGGRLVHAAAGRAAAEGLIVVPWCPFARRWLSDHPDVAFTALIDWDTAPPDHKTEAVMADTCTHLDTLTEVTPSSDGCEDCLRVGGEWVHLRLCMHCGHVGCCDSSPNRHATAHWDAHSDHPVIRSYEPGEDWWWCYADDLFFEIDGSPSSPSHP